MDPKESGFDPSRGSNRGNTGSGRGPEWDETSPIWSGGPKVVEMTNTGQIRYLALTANNELLTKCYDVLHKNMMSGYPFGAASTCSVANTARDVMVF